VTNRYLYLLDGLTWRRFVWTIVLAAGAAASVVWYFQNTYYDLLKSALCMGFSIMLAVTIAGNLRQTFMPREGAQLLGVLFGSFGGILLVGIVKGRDLAEMFTERLWGVTITTSLGIGFGCVITAAMILREQRSRMQSDLLRAESEKHRLEKQVMEARLQVMQAQVEPHFLFNTLANVQHLVESDAKGAGRMLDNLIRYLRIALPQMRESSSTLGREMDMAAAYLEIFKIRMGARLDYSMSLPSDLRDQEFPPMMLITLVENAIKHGLDPCCDAGVVELSAVQRDGKLIVRVADTGEGFQPKTGGGVGLANIRERLSTLYGKAAKLTLEENQPRGVVATIELPQRGMIMAEAA
jgi:signal transduction histidine kinase